MPIVVTGAGAGVGRATVEGFAKHGYSMGPLSRYLGQLKVHLTVVDLPAVNTPQFDWVLNKMGRRAQPVPAICQPEVPQRLLGRSRCCTRPPNGWTSERLR